MGDAEDMVIELLNKIIHEVYKGKVYSSQVYVGKSQSTLLSMAIQRGITYKLFDVSKNYISLTEKGHEVIDAGNFVAWKELVREREEEKHRAEVDTAVATKQSKNAAWFSGIISALALILTLYALLKDTKPDPEIKRLQQQIDSLKTRLQVNPFMELKHSRVDTDSLTR